MHGATHTWGQPALVPLYPPLTCLTPHLPHSIRTPFALCTRPCTTAQRAPACIIIIPSPPPLHPEPPPCPQPVGCKLCKNPPPPPPILTPRPLLSPHPSPPPPPPPGRQQAPGQQAVQGRPPERAWPAGGAAAVPRVLPRYGLCVPHARGGPTGKALVRRPGGFHASPYIGARV